MLLSLMKKSWSKSFVKRTSSLILTVFMLQVVAAGFCMPTVSAAPVKQVSTMEHCMTGDMTMAGMNMDETMIAHACAHCDLPDVSVPMDKHNFDAVDLTADLLVLAIVPTASDIQAIAFVDAPPSVLTAQTSLTTFNLNLRIRV